MFLIFGIKSSDKHLGSHVRPCEVCGVTAAQVLFRRTTKVSLFFIPLFPVRRSTYYLRCGNCWAARAADPHWAASVH